MTKPAFATLLALVALHTSPSLASNQGGELVPRVSALPMDPADCSVQLDTNELPAPPLDLNDPRQRMVYIRDMAATLSHNDKSIGSTLENVASRSHNIDYIRRSMGDGRSDKERMTMLRAGQELMDISDSISVGNRFSAGEVVGHVDGVARKVARLALKVLLARKFIPKSLGTRFEIYGHRPIDFEQVVGAIKEMLSDLRDRKGHAYNEITLLEMVVAEAEAKAAEYRTQHEAVSQRLNSDRSLSAVDKERLESAIVKPLLAAEQRIAVQIASYRSQITQRYAFLQMADPVIENTAATAENLIPSMRLALMMQNDALALSHTAAVKPQMEKITKTLFETSVATLQRVANDTRNAHLPEHLTPEFFDGISRKMEDLARDQKTREERLLPELMKSVANFNRYNENQRMRQAQLSETAPMLNLPHLPE